MKRKLLLLSLCVACFTGCASENEEVAVPVAESSVAVSESAKDKDSTEAGADSDTDASVREEELDKSLYEKFLANEATVHINYDEDYGAVYTHERMKTVIPEDNTLEELVNALIEDYLFESPETKISVEGIEYAYIDCGNDDTDELAIKISITTSTEYWTDFFVIKEIAGQLEAVYQGISWSRTNLAINEYGYIYEDISDGAAYHIFKKSFVDTKGKWHFLYSDYSTSMMSSEAYSDIWLNGGIHRFEGELDGDYAFLSFDFDNNSEEESDCKYTYAKCGEAADIGYYGYKGYFYTELIRDDSVYNDENLLKKYLDNEGIQYYTIFEIDEMVAEKEQQEGLTQEIKNGEAAKWQELNYDFKPYIETKNDNNLLMREEFFPLEFNLCVDVEDTEYAHLSLESDGIFTCSYDDYRYSDEYSTMDQNSYSGNLIVIGYESENIYNLHLESVQLDHEPGVVEQKEKSCVSYVDPELITYDSSEYLLYAPGTLKSEINEAVLAKFNDNMMNDYFDEDVLNKYILFENGGNNSVWSYWE